MSNGEKTMLYAHDTGYFPDETWDYLERKKPVFNFVSIDCTGMFENYRQGHMGLSADADTKDRMIKEGLATDKTVFCCNHFSHNGRALHSDLEAFFQPRGIEVAFDGLVVEV